MALNLPQIGQRAWGTAVNAILELLDTGLDNLNQRVTDAEANVSAISGLTGEDDAVAFLVADTGSATRAATDTAVGDFLSTPGTATQAGVDAAAAAAVADTGSDTRAALDPLLAGKLDKSGADLDPGANVTLETDGTTSTISRMIALKAGHVAARPWISWVDENDRHRVAMGYHTETATGNVHEAFEIKISDDPLGANPGGMATRLSMSTDVEVGTAEFLNTDELKVGRSHYAAGSLFGLMLATPSSTDPDQNLDIGQFRAQLTAGDDTILDISAIPLATSKTGTITFFRASNSTVSNGAQIAVKKGDGTNNNAFLLNATRSWFQLYNTSVPPSSSAAGSGHLYAEGGALKWRGSSGTVTTIANA